MTPRDTSTVQIGPAAPEPASMAMVGLGVAGMGLVARRGWSPA